MADQPGSGTAPGSPPPAPPATPPPTAPAASWRDALPSEIKDSPYLSKLDTVAALASEHVNAQKLIGKKGVIPPGADGKPEDWDRFYESLGRPKTSADYKLEGIAPPEGVPWDADVQADIVAQLHAAGATQTQVEKVLRGMMERQSSRWRDYSAEVSQQKGAAEAALKQEWGSAYAAKLDVANRAYAAAFGEKGDGIRTLQLADGSALGDHPEVVRAFAALGEKMGEHGLAVGDSVGRRGTFTPEEARAEIAAMHGDEKVLKALNDRMHPEHEFAVKKRDALYSAAYPEQK